MVGGTYLGFQEIRCRAPGTRCPCRLPPKRPCGRQWWWGGRGGGAARGQAGSGWRTERAAEVESWWRPAKAVDRGDAGRAEGEEEDAGRRRHQSGAREGSARGNRGDRVAASRACGLPNGGKSWPEAESHAVGLSWGNSGIPAGFWAPKGGLIKINKTPLLIRNWFMNKNIVHTLASERKRVEPSHKIISTRKH
jgi:hypothetical protein